MRQISFSLRVLTLESSKKENVQSEFATCVIHMPCSHIVLFVFKNANSALLTLDRAADDDVRSGDFHIGSSTGGAGSFFGVCVADGFVSCLRNMVFWDVLLQLIL